MLKNYVGVSLGGFCFGGRGWLGFGWLELFVWGVFFTSGHQGLNEDKLHIHSLLFCVLS